MFLGEDSCVSVLPVGFAESLHSRGGVSHGLGRNKVGGSVSSPVARLKILGGGHSRR